jgi:2-polyprenyl-6-methoxyphenol hydroxylase-like FAD-dependent oxidoreductase
MPRFPAPLSSQVNKAMPRVLYTDQDYDNVALERALFDDAPGLPPAAEGAIRLAPDQWFCFRELWPEATATIAQADDFSRATYRNVALPSWYRGRVLFMGDAAHGTSPQLGQGANLALLDAWTLADTLAAGGDLLDFARRRCASVRFYRQASHLLTPLFQSGLVPLGWMRDAFAGWACRLAVSRHMATTTLAGRRNSWFSSATLDAEGRYCLDSAAQRPGVSPKRAEK